MNSKRLTPKRKALAEQWVMYARKRAWTYARKYPNVPVDELHSWAFELLCYAAAMYDADKSKEFAPYFNMITKHHMFRLINQWLSWDIDQFPMIDASENFVWGPGTDPHRNHVHELADAELLERIRGLIPADWFDLLFRIHVEGKTFTDVAREDRISRQRVKQKLDQTTAYVRECVAMA